MGRILKNTSIAAPLKYVSNFCKSLIIDYLQSGIDTLMDKALSLIYKIVKLVLIWS